MLLLLEFLIVLRYIVSELHFLMNFLGCRHLNARNILFDNYPLIKRPKPNTIQHANKEHPTYLLPLLSCIITLNFQLCFLLILWSCFLFFALNSLFTDFINPLFTQFLKYGCVLMLVNQPLRLMLQLVLDLVSFQYHKWTEVIIYHEALLKVADWVFRLFRLLFCLILTLCFGQCDH